MPSDKVLNPATGKLVLATGKIGKAILEGKAAARKTTKAAPAKTKATKAAVPLAPPAPEKYHVFIYNSTGSEIGLFTFKTFEDLASYIRDEHEELVNIIISEEDDESLAADYPLDTITENNLGKIARQMSKVVRGYMDYASDNHMVFGYIVKGGVVM